MTTEDSAGIIEAAAAVTAAAAAMLWQASKIPHHQPELNYLDWFETPYYPLCHRSLLPNGKNLSCTAHAQILLSLWILTVSSSPTLCSLCVKSIENKQTSKAYIEKVHKYVAVVFHHVQLIFLAFFCGTSKTAIADIVSVQNLGYFQLQSTFS